MTPVNWNALGAVAAIVLAIGALWAAVRGVFAPHIKNIIVDTLDTQVGPQLKEVPKLTVAVDRLTEAIQRQTGDTERLTTSMGELGAQVTELLTDVREHKVRIENIEKAVIPTGRRQRKRI